MLLDTTNQHLDFNDAGTNTVQGGSVKMLASQPATPANPPFILDNFNNVTSGKLLSLRNQGVEKANLDFAGNLQAASLDAQAAAGLTVGGTNATGVTLGKAGVNTTLGAKLNVPTGAAGIAGTSAAMVAGTTTINTTAVTAASVIILTYATAAGTQGFLRVGVITAGTSFTIVSSSGTDTSTVNWWIVN